MRQRVILDDSENLDINRRPSLDRNRSDRSEKVLK